MDSRCLSFYLSFIQYNNFFYFVNVLFIFIPMFDLMLILLKNNLIGNKNNLGTAIGYIFHFSDHLSKSYYDQGSAARVETL